MIFSALVDDPGEHLPPEQADQERRRLFSLVERLSTFESYNDSTLLAEARSEISKAFDGEPLPTLIDPFCGGGSTLLEAQRLGLPTIGSDLNPIPSLITTVLCRVSVLFSDQNAVSTKTRSGPSDCSHLHGFKSDVRHYATRIRELAWKSLGKYYPNVKGATPFAYRWAWTVESPNPAAHGRHTPLVSNWWLSKHKQSPSWIKAIPGNKGIRFVIQTDGNPPPPSTGRTAANCLLSNIPIPLEYIREQGRAGRLGRTLIAIAARKDGRTFYFPPDSLQLDTAVSPPEPEIAGIPMPPAALGFRVQQYGTENFVDLFTRRQAYTLETFARLVAEIHSEVVNDSIRAGLSDDDLPLESGGSGARAYADSIAAVLSLAVGKMAQSNSSLVRWFIDPRNGSGKATPAFDRHAIPMVWDFVETNPFGGSVGDWLDPVLKTALMALELTSTDVTPTHVYQRDARSASRDLPKTSMIATDPPYYANIGYADLSDYFYLWIREGLQSCFPSMFRTIATPKEAELIATPFRHHGSIERANDYFRSGFSEVFGALSKKADPRLPMLIAYAVKQTEEDDEEVSSTGWEVFLEGLVDAGISIVATWPVRTTTQTRMIGLKTNALASAVFVVGRTRPPDAPIGSRRDLVSALKRDLPLALRHLQRENIAPVDLAQAAIGPGMAIYTQYTKVLDARGEPIGVHGAIALINQILDEAMAEQEGDFDAPTRWALAWFEQFGFEEGAFGIAETLSKAKATSIEGLVDAGIVKSKRGKVRLLMPRELSDGWDPGLDDRLTAWESVHHLIRELETGGEAASAALAAKLGARAEPIRELAYRLFTICERSHWCPEAHSYNALVQSWPEILRLAAPASFQQGAVV